MASNALYFQMENDPIWLIFLNWAEATKQYTIYKILSLMLTFCFTFRDPKEENHRRDCHGLGTLLCWKINCAMCRVVPFSSCDPHTQKCNVIFCVDYFCEGGQRYCILFFRLKFRYVYDIYISLDIYNIYQHIYEYPPQTYHSTWT